MSCPVLSVLLLSIFSTSLCVCDMLWYFSDFGTHDFDWIYTCCTSPIKEITGKYDSYNTHKVKSNYGTCTSIPYTLSKAYIQQDSEHQGTNVQLINIWGEGVDFHLFVNMVERVLCMKVRHIKLLSCGSKTILSNLSIWMNYFAVLSHWHSSVKVMNIQWPALNLIKLLYLSYCACSSKRWFLGSVCIALCVIPLLAHVGISLRNTYSVALFA